MVTKRRKRVLAIAGAEAGAILVLATVAWYAFAARPSFHRNLDHIVSRAGFERTGQVAGVQQPSGDFIYDEAFWSVPLSVDDSLKLAKHIMRECEGCELVDGATPGDWEIKTTVEQDPVVSIKLRRAISEGSLYPGQPEGATVTVNSWKLRPPDFWDRVLDLVGY